MNIERRISITPFDEKHVLSDCDVIFNAAKRNTDKIISSGQLLYIACGGNAVVLDTEDGYACVLSEASAEGRPEMGDLNGRWCILWPQKYSFCDSILTVTDRFAGDVKLQMKVYSELSDLVRMHGAERAG